MEEQSEKLAMEVEKNEKPEAEEPKIHYRGWKVMPFIIGNEVFEKLGIIGTLSNLLVYLTSVFNMKSITAATIINVFGGTTNFGTFFAALLCDTYFGRYKTLGFAIITCFLGSIVMLLTAAVPNLHPPPCGNKENCERGTAGQITFLLTGLILLIIGAGGIRPCNLPFGADQFNPNKEQGKKGIDSFFNWYFFTFTFAQMVSLTLIVYVQSNVSWTIGLAIPAIMMFLGCIVYFGGSKLYVKVEASGSPMLSIAQVIVVSIKKRRLNPVQQPWVDLYNYIPPKSMNSKLGYTDQFRFLDKAAILTPDDRLNPDGSPADPWKLCSLQQVEEVKCLVRVTPIWIAASIYNIAIIQQMTYPVFQALQTNRHLGSGSFQIPAASYVVFLMLGMTAFIPIYDRLLVPFLRRFTGIEAGITTLQRMGIGMLLSIISMVVAAAVEDRRRNIALTRPNLGIAPRKGAISSMSGFWLIPQLSLAGIAEAFSAIGQMEFYYKQFPENMRSFAGSLFYCGLGASNYLSGFLISIVHDTTKTSPSGNWLPEDLNKGRLDYFYYTIAGLMVLDLGCFLLISSWYRYKGVSTVPVEDSLEVKQSDKDSA